MNKKRKGYYPIFTVPAYVKRLSSKFYLNNKVIEVEVSGELMESLLETCDGQKTIEEVVNSLSKKWDKQLLRSFLEHLQYLEILCDSSSISSNMWTFVKNPTRFYRELSDSEISKLVAKAEARHKQKQSGIFFSVKTFALQGIIKKRRSIRFFTKKIIDTQTIVKMLWAGYGIVKNENVHFLRHTVPSAGALYPLNLSLVLFRRSDKLNEGVYDINVGKPRKIGFMPRSKDIIAVRKSLADPLGFKNAQGLIVISGSFKVVEEKYGNRAILYVVIEAGHVAQNIQLVATELNVGTVEVGGFFEYPLREALGLPGDHWPLTIIVFGCKSEEMESEIDQPKNLEVKWASGFTENYKLPFSMVFTRLQDQRFQGWACGRDKEPSLALLKASVEVDEWAACGYIPNDLKYASFEDLKIAIDPRKIIKYHPAQYQRKNFSLKLFNPTQRYYWKKGKNLFTAQKVYILSDFIYFPYDPPTSRYTYANSSGTSAHYDKQEAIKHATLELIERDSFMIVWLNRLLMSQINFKTLPSDIRKRIRELNKIGFKVIVKDFTLDLTPVIFVFAQSHKLPFTTCAACSSFNVLEALEHALMEVEATIYCRLDQGQSPIIKLREVNYTDDHGSLYEQHDYFRQADFLIPGPQIHFNAIQKNSLRSWDDLVNTLDRKGYFLLISELLQSKKTFKSRPLNIVKVFIPGLIPMTFGFGNEPFGMERIYRLPVEEGLLKRSRFYRELTKFPHPYT